MRSFILVLALASPAYAETYGSFTLKDQKAIPLETAVSTFKEGEVKPLHVEGTVEQVCEKEGCWMTLHHKDQAVRVMFKDHSFFVGKKLIGKRVVAEGILSKKVQTIAQQKHYLEDAGAPKKDIDAITKDKETFIMTATAVKTI